MTKQEIIDAIKSKCIPIYDDVVGYDFDWIADTLLAKIEHEKKDTLKEFVEWLKQGFDKRMEEQFKECNRMLEEGDNGEYLDQYDEVFANMEGILQGYTDAKWWIEDFYTVENFLKEREK